MSGGRGGTEQMWPAGDAVLSEISDGCVMLDRDLRVTYANAASGALLGLAPHALLGRSLSRDVPGAVAVAIRGEAAQTLATGAGRRVQAYDPATERWVEARLHPLPDGLLVMLVDVTDAVRARTAAVTPGAPKTSVASLGDLPWGAHVCQFYGSRQDLLDIVLPYFRAGLARNERCLWVVSDALPVDAASDALRDGIREADRHLARGDIEVVPHTRWYLERGTFDERRVLDGWNAKLEEALERGYAGLRVSADEAWLTEATGPDFIAYERALNEMLRGRRMVVLCAYPLAASTGARVFDVARVHQYAVTRREGEWEVIEVLALAEARAALQRQKEALERRVADRTGELAAANAELRRQMRERELVEAARRRGEAYLKEAERLSHTGSFGWTPATDEIHWSAETYRLFGVDPATPPTRALILERVHPDDRDRVVAAAEGVRQEGKDLDVEFRLLMPGGAVKHLHVVGGAVVDDAGRREFVGAVTDVTRQREAEAERRAHLWFFESLDRANRVIQRATDLEQMMRDVLDVVLAIFDADEAGFMYPCDVDAPVWTVPMFRTPPALATQFAEATRGEATVPRTREAVEMVRLLRATDSPVQFGPGPGQHPQPDVNRMFRLQSSMDQAVYPKGDRPYLFGIGQVRFPRVWTPEEERLFQEIGRRLADALTSLTSRRDLRASEARFRALVEHGLDLIAILDERAVHRYASPSYEVVLGYTPQEMVGTNAFDFVHPDDAATLRGVLSPDALRAGPQRVPPVRVRHRDGSWRTLIGIVTDMRGEPAVGGIVANGRDVTEQLQLEEQLRQSQKMEAVGRLAGGVAHDFNNLLTVIVGYSDFIRATSAPDDEHRRDAEEIRRAADRAALLTQQLLAFSRKQVLRPEVLEINRVVDEASRMLGRLIGEDVALELRLAPDAGAVRIDAGQLQQVLLNLAVNARDAMPTGGRLTIETAPVVVEREEPAQPAPLAPGRYVRLAVRDTGTGMSREVLARAFEPFYTTKAPGKGTGLGLSTVYGIVTQSNGHLRVATAPGRGTAFELFFPFAGAPAAAASQEAPGTVGGAETVLLVEDDAMVRRLAAATLERAGYRVLAATSGADALRLAAGAGGSIDLVITDVVMPGLPGPTLAQRLEAAYPGLRVLYVSGYADDTMARYGVSEERVRFLAKPFTPEALARRVREVLDAAS